MNLHRRMNRHRPRYEVDLQMLPAGSVAADVSPFCAVLETVMSEGGQKIVAVETFRAYNNPNDFYPGFWGWPTVDEWNLAIERYFGVQTLPFDAERYQRILHNSEKPEPRFRIVLR